MHKYARKMYFYAKIYKKISGGESIPLSPACKAVFRHPFQRATKKRFPARNAQNLPS